MATNTVSERDSVAGGGARKNRWKGVTGSQCSVRTPVHGGKEHRLGPSFRLDGQLGFRAGRGVTPGGCVVPVEKE